MPHTAAADRSHTHSCRHSMPCAAASHCRAVPDHTPGPPDFTNHPCKVCGKYLHGTCGVADPLGESEMHRVCHTCLSSRGRENSGADTAWVWLGGWRGGTVGSCCRRGVGMKYSNNTLTQPTECIHVRKMHHMKTCFLSSTLVRTRYQVLAAGTLLANKQVEQCVS